MSFDKKKWIMNCIRRASYRFPPRWAAKVSARIERGQYECNSCKKIFKDKEIELDHIEPVNDPVLGFTTWDEFIRRMFPDESGFQVLCTECHLKKSISEGVVRRKRRKKLDKIDE